MQKVLVITYYWPPSGGAGVQRWVKLCRYLPNFGIQPIVLTVDPDHASYPVLDQSLECEISPDLEVYRTKSFEPLQIYERLVGKKNVPTAGFSNVDKKKLSTRIAARIRSTLFIPDPRKGWNKYAFEKAKELINTQQIDKIVTTGPPHSTHLIGLKLKNELGIEWTADMRDPWTDIYYYKDLHHTKRSGQKDKRLELEVLSYADRVICANSELKTLLLQRSTTLDQDKFHVLTNGYDPEDLDQKGHSSNDDHFWITYTGTISEHYSPEIFFRAISCKENRDVHIRFVGTVSNDILGKARSLGIAERIEVVPTVPHKESIRFLLGSDALLLVIPEVDHDESIVPGKLFEYLGAAKPIICIGPKNGASAMIIEECRAGRTFDRNSFEQLSTYLIEIKKEGFISPDKDKILSYSRRSQARILRNILLDQA